MKKIKNLFILFYFLAFTISSSAFADRLKDLTSIAGIRSNQLIGYGLVVGLAGTGDGNTQLIQQSMKSMVSQLGLSTDSGSLNGKNAASVMITAELPPFVKPGQNIDITVSTLGAAKSLRGGTLLMTPLKGADGETYAIAQGICLGVISMIFNNMYPGIVVQAVFLTFGTLGALLLAYKSGLIEATENFKLGVAAATGGIAILYLINFIMSFFGSGVGVISSNDTMGILFSGFVVVIAALNLVLDFDFIEEGAEKGAPKYMEWYGAFGLLVTLIWLYLEILRLLAKLQSRR